MFSKKHTLLYTLIVVALMQMFPASADAAKKAAKAEDEEPAGCED